MEVKVEKPSQNGVLTDQPKSATQAASTINMIANKLANSKAQQASASETLTQLSLALGGKPMTVSSSLSNQNPIQFGVFKPTANSQSKQNTITIVTSQVQTPTNQPQISLLTSQPSICNPSTGNQASNSVLSKMTEVLSLKQSPTLTKQLTTPISGAMNKVQVITAYMCRYCGQQFDSPAAMQQHIQNHVNGKTPHQCSVCGKEYRTPSKLQRHVRVHSGERPYACTICGRRFTRSDHVKQHMKVHMTVKELNICRICNDMKFNRRQTLHLHLQQSHHIHAVFTCHRCGEAYESLEEMQGHKLTHDAILNSLKDGRQRSFNSPPGIAKFALGPQKVDTVNSFEPIKVEKETPEGSKSISILDKIEPNGLYVPANLDSMTNLGNTHLIEGITKEAIELEIQKKYEEELNQMRAERDKLKSKLEEENKETETENKKRKIAECFSIKPDGTSKENKGMDVDVMSSDYSECSKKAKTFVSDDGMSMFIVQNNGEGLESKDHADDDDEDDDDDEMGGLMIATDQNSSKESGIGEENEDGFERIDEVSNDGDESNSKFDRIKETKESKISVKSTNHVGGYTKPCPKSKKPSYLLESNNNTETTNSNIIDVKSEIQAESSAPKAISLLNDSLKLKQEQDTSVNDVKNTPFKIATTNSHARIIPSSMSLPPLTPMPKLTLIPNTSTATNLQTSSLQNYFLPISSGSLILSSAANKAANNTEHTQVTAMSSQKDRPDTSKLYRCEHCCIYFEDRAMSLLHDTLHEADEADPFTCRKCLKKLGNRLEFMAHLVWHLEPNMDI